MSLVSYAQNYEDVMLMRAFRGVEQGFYIDVGAQDPVGDSVTKAFYKLGWRGINIEPVSHWFRRLQVDRPHDINLQIAVSDSPGELHLFEVEDSGLSTTDSNFAAKHAQAGYRILESDVPCITLDDICETHNVGEVHFLKIDCEGAEAAALRGFELARVRPWVILLEATEPNSQKPLYKDWEPLLTGRGYHFVYEDGLNRFYVADEHADIDAAFAHPPNVFDYFVRAPEALAREQLESARVELQALQDLQRVTRLESECSQLRANVEYFSSENERREAALVEHRQRIEDAAKQEAILILGLEVRLAASVSELARSEADLASLRGTLKESAAEGLRLQAALGESVAESLRLHTEVGRLHHEVKNRDGEVLRLHRLIEDVQASTSWRITSPLRLAKRWIKYLLRALFRVVYALLRWPARLVRPLFRGLARWPWLRSVVGKLFDEKSRLAIHGRLFLFGAASVEHYDSPLELTPACEPLTRRGGQILEEIQESISKRRLENSQSKFERK